MDRHEMRRRGLTRYQGRPCAHGHGGERFTRDGSCVECERARLSKLVKKQRAEKHWSLMARYKRRTMKRVQKKYAKIWGQPI